VWLGTLAEAVDGKQPLVWLSTSKEQVVAVVGKRGSGKSFTLGVIVEGLVACGESGIGRQEHPRAVLLFDPLDVYWTTRFPVASSENPEAQRHFEIAKSAGLAGLEFDVETWIPGDQNRRTTDPSWFRTLKIRVSALTPDEWEILLDVSVMADPMGQALTDAIHLVREQGFTAGGDYFAPTEAYDFADLTNALRAPDLSGVYHDETLRALRQRLGALDRTGLFDGQGTRIGELLRAGSAAVVSLGRLPQSYRSAVVAVLTRMLIEARSVGAFAEKRLALDPDIDEPERKELDATATGGVPRTTVVLDEAQSFLAPGVAKAALALFVRLVKEGRNLGLSAVVATQQPSAIDRRILSQVETFVAHQLVTEADIRAVRENLKAELPDSVQSSGPSAEVGAVVRLLPPGVCLVSSAEMNTTLRRSLILSVRARASVHGGIEL
jgi:hypothetical protein